MEWQLFLRFVESGHEGLQGPLPEHVAGRTVVDAESSGDDGSSDVHIHEGFPQPVNPKFPAVCLVRIGRVQLLLDSLGYRNNIAGGQCEFSEACGCAAAASSNSRSVLELHSLDRTDRSSLDAGYRFRKRSQRSLVVAAGDLVIGSGVRVRTGLDVFRDGRLRSRYAVCGGILQHDIVLAGTDFLFCRSRAILWALSI